MSSQPQPAPSPVDGISGIEARGSLSRTNLAENWVVTAALAAMVMLPLTESLLRSLANTGISASTSLTQHLTLFVGMLGGAIAAREGRLLALSTGAFLPERLRAGVRVAANSFGAGISILLAVASWEFALSERLGGAVLAYGIPIWVVQLVMPGGFAVIAARLIWHASDRAWLRGLALLIALAMVGIGAQPWVSPERLVVPGLVALLAATVLGTPVFTTLGGAALILFWGAGQPIASISLDHYRLVTNPSLPTIPLFTLAGYFLAEGGASKRLINVFQALAGHLRGGPAIVTALVCAFFTSFTGASGVTILALGGLLMPVLLSAKYSERSALGLLTGAGSLGLLFPPCLPLILYAIVARIPIDRMFLAGIVPGLLLVALTAAWGVKKSNRSYSAERKFSFEEARRAIWIAKWELLLPVVAVAALFGGFATPVEAAALTALYAFVIETFLYRDLSIRRDVPKVMGECGLLVGGVLLILGVALGFTNYLVDAEIPTRTLDWATASIHSPLVFLALLNLFLLVVGCLMDIFSAIIVVVPLLVPLGEAFGIDPVHLGIIFLANLELGYLTPPVGMNLFLSSYRFHKPMPEVYRSVIPMLIVLLIGVLLITYLPAMTLWLPNWIGRN
jgi:C4-dicarboxylate transporter, DctM subunit